MGSACCVAARDGTVSNRPSTEILHQNTRHSTSWSFRWDKKVRVVKDETSLDPISDDAVCNDQVYMKSGPRVETADASGVGSPLESVHSLMQQKSSAAKFSNEIIKLQIPDSSIPGNHSEVDLMESPLNSASLVSSLSMSPLSFQGHPLLPRSTPSRWLLHSPGHHLLRQASDSLIPTTKSSAVEVSNETSSFTPPGCSYESMKGSVGGSSGSWSFDSETLGFVQDRLTRSTEQTSGHNFGQQACCICAKLLTEKSSWDIQKIVATNELAVAAVLICGHVYHAECLEHMTTDVNKYDPACPVCTFGEKQTFELSEKALKAELNIKPRKRSRTRIAEGDLRSDLVPFGLGNCGEQEGVGKLSSTPRLKSSTSRPFLRRHFSFGLKGSKSLANQSSMKGGSLWERSSKQLA